MPLAAALLVFLFFVVLVVGIWWVSQAQRTVRERLKRSGMWRQPAPADRAGKAKVVEHLGIEIVDAALQNLAFP